MKILIVGASGYLGKHVYIHFKRNYDDVIGTYCTHPTTEGLIHFDLNKDNIKYIGDFAEGQNGCAIICAAEAKYDACKIKGQESYQTNVTSTIRLIEELKRMEYHIIFCSTDSVYSGTKGNYTETDQAKPVNEYGQMKLQVEQYLTEHCPDACIFRLSKMLGDTDSSSDTLLQWKNMAIEKKPIYCIKGNCFSPVDVEDVVNCIEIACNKRVSGIYNVCGNEVFRRSELCLSFLHALKLDTDVYEQDLDAFGFSANRPLNVGMCNQKATDFLGYRFKKIEDIYPRYM